MSESIYGVKEGQHIPGATLNRYLTDFAKHFGIYERSKLNTKAEEILPNSTGGWQIKTTTPSGETETIETKRLVLATGLTSEPNIPQYKGQEDFTPPFFHAKDFHAREDLVGQAKSVIVVGGGKSSYDVSYAFATMGNATVDMIIRPTGQGPVWLAPPYVTPLKRKMEELLHTRALTWFAPCAWGDEDGFGISRSFLHKTPIGRFLVENYWNTMTADLEEANGYHEDAEVFKLKPWNPAFWTGSGIGINNFPTDFFGLVKEGKIRVHIADIESLEGKMVNLSNGEKLETDAVICATGWKKDSKLKVQVPYEGGLGLVHTASERQALIKKADKEILDQLPGLKRQPVLRYTRTQKDPQRLYRFIVPPGSVHQRNLAFAGMVSTVSTALFANTQALWISAFFDGKLKRIAQTDKDITDEVMRHTQFVKWRYPCGYGDTIPDFAFESMPYVDMLLNDVGINIHRKRNQIAELFEPYKPWDYKDLKTEYEGISGSKAIAP